MAWIGDLRITLLLSLAALIIIILWRRFKQRTVARELPVASHAELVGLEVLYHPERLRVEVVVPHAERVHPGMLDTGHSPLHRWPDVELSSGAHVLELPLNGHGAGEFYFELATASQRTVRKFRVIRA